MFGWFAKKVACFQRQPAIDFLETADLDDIYDMSSLGAGPVQQARIRKLVEPIAYGLADVVRGLGGAA